MEEKNKEKEDPLLTDIEKNIIKTTEENSEKYFKIISICWDQF